MLAGSFLFFISIDVCFPPQSVAYVPPPRCPCVDMRNVLLYIIYKFKRVEGQIG